MTRKDNKVRIGKVRMAYVHLDEPRAFDESQTPKYEVTAIIDKTDATSLAAVKKSYELAIENGKEKYGKAFERKITPLIRAEGSDNGLMIDCDADERYAGDEDYKGKYMLGIKSKTQPATGSSKFGTKHVLTKEEIQDELYSGCYGFIYFNFYPYQFNGGTKMGISAGLDSVYKTDDGESLGGRTNNLNAFADLDDNSFDGLDPDDLPF